MVVLLHGGFWRDGWDRTLMTPLAHDLAARGFLAWNVEYRRVGQDGGGWPGTLADVAAAVDALADVPEADVGRVVAVGHSAGGHLALWLAARDRLPDRCPGRRRRASAYDSPSRSPGSQIWCAELRRASVAGRATRCSAARRRRCRSATPSRRLPPCSRSERAQLLVHGLRDDVVPPSQSSDYAAAARAAGDDVELLELPEADHFDVIVPSEGAWPAVAARLADM